MLPLNCNIYSLAFNFIQQLSCVFLSIQSGEIDVVNHRTGDRCHLKFAPYSYFSRDVARKVSQQLFHWLLFPRMQTCQFCPLSFVTLWTCSWFFFFLACSILLYLMSAFTSFLCNASFCRSRGLWRIKMGKRTMFSLGRGTRRWNALVWCRAAEGGRTAPTDDRKPSIKLSKPKSCGGRLRCRKIFPNTYN